MAIVTDKFVSSYLNNKLLEAVKPLNEVKDALGASQSVLKAESDRIIQAILKIQG
jgi:hypothetical protein